MEFMIAMEGIGKTYKEGLCGKKIQALQDLDLTVPRGEVFGFLGPNGAGKSTTIKVMLNLIRPDRGRATLLGRDVRDPGIRKQTGYLPENPYFYDYLTAEELLRFGGQASGVPWASLKSRIPCLLEAVGLKPGTKRHLRSYSKGMVQRVGLALALVNDPELVILDEPMSGLDPLGRKMVCDLILGLKGQGKTVFFSSHILNDIERLCDRIAIVSEGRLRLAGPLREVLPPGENLENLFLRTIAVGGEGAS